MSNAPDIEIYVPNLTTEQAITWLESVFENCTLAKKKKGMPKNAQPINVQWQSQTIFGIVIEKAAPGFTSIWLNSRQLPWANDKECAEAAAQHFDSPVRFVTDSWDQKQEPGAWSEIDTNGQIKQIIWKS